MFPFSIERRRIGASIEGNSSFYAFLRHRPRSSYQQLEPHILFVRRKPRAKIEVNGACACTLLYYGKLHRFLFAFIFIHTQMPIESLRILHLYFHRHCTYIPACIFNLNCTCALLNEF